MIVPLILEPADRPKPESANPPPGFWIAGQRARPSSGETFESIDPTTGTSLARLATAARADIDAAVGAAGKAFASPAWSGLDPSRRERLLLQVAEVIETNAEETSRRAALLNSRRAAQLAEQTQDRREPGTGRGAPPRPGIGGPHQSGSSTRYRTRTGSSRRSQPAHGRPTADSQQH